MDVFGVNSQILQRFGMCLSIDNTSKRVKLLSRSVNLLFFWISICTVIISIEYIVSHFDDTENILFAVMQVAANIASGCGYWAFYQKKYQVADFIKKIQDLVTKRYKSNNLLKPIYDKTERKSILVSKWPLLMFCMNYDVVLIVTTIYTVIFKVIPSKTDPATWYSMYKMSAPFNVHSVHGYFWYLFMVIVALHTYAILITSQLSFFLSSCFYLEAFCQDLDQTMLQLNNVQFNNRLKKRLSSIIHFNVQITELFQQLNDVVAGIIFFQLFCGAIFCSTCVYQLDLASKHIGADFFILLFASTVSIATTLPYCYYSAHISVCIQSIGDSAYLSSIWFQFPTDVQKYILMIIENSQQPRYFTAYGIVNCSLETFKKILNTTASYYIMFKSVMNR